MHTVSRAWRVEVGANVAQAAAVALLSAALIGAVILFAPQLRQRVEADFGCLAGALSGDGGAGCPGAAPTSLEELGEGEGGDSCDWKCQILGFLKGFLLGGWDALWGLVSLAKDLVLLLIGDDETWAKYRQLVEAFMRDPVGVAQALLGEMAAPILEAWNDGRYGEASGRLLFEVISSIGGTKALNTLADLGKLDEVGDIGRVVDDLPCTTATPAGKAPGLAKPLADSCTLPSRPPDPDAVPDGRPETINPNDAPENIRALTRQNESADTLAQAGYDIEHNPPTLPNGKNPDYRIDGEYFDNYAPTTSSPRNIASVIQGKVDSGQTNRIVLNLDDSSVDLDALRQQLTDYPIENLEEILVIRDGEVVPFWPPPAS